MHTYQPVPLPKPPPDLAVDTRATVGLLREDVGMHDCPHAPSKGSARAAQRSHSPGRAVIVGNSDGIGYALTRRLLDEGWRVTGLSRSPSDLRHVRYRHAVTDVTSLRYPELLAAELDTMGCADLCVHAAGVGEFADVTDLSPQTRREHPGPRLDAMNWQTARSFA
jgi:hypothetical protein